MEMKAIAQRLIVEEFRAKDTADTKARAAFRVCDKLRRHLSVFTGVAGFRSLLSRALTLATAEIPWLGRVRINPDGSFDVPAEIEAYLEHRDAAKGGNVLIARLLGLLVTFIGESLALRFVQDVWPNVVLEKLKLEGDKL